MYCEDIQDMDLTNALQSLMDLFVEHMKQQGRPFALLYPYSIPLYHHLGWEIISNKISFNIKDRQIPTKVKAPGYVRRVDWDNTDFHELHSHFASITHGCLFRNALAWEEYWCWDEDDTNVAVYYNTKDKPCGFMVYLIKNDIMHIKETIRPYALERIEGKQEAVDRLDDVLYHKIPYISDYI